MFGMNVQLNIISYAVISTKFESGSNLIECFLPLVEHVLSLLAKDYVEEVNINDTYEEVYGYRIHSAILSQLLKILQKQGKIEKLKGECIQINKSALKSYELKEEYDLNLRALISEVDLFCKRKGHMFSREIISKGIIEFLHKNAIDFNSFINYNSNMDIVCEGEELFDDLIEFLLEERRNNTKHYAFIKEIFAGIVLSSIIVSDKEVVDSFKEDFHIGNVLLDSNYIFRLLDLQTSLEYQAAQDTYKALSNNGCTFWVCKETVKQIADTIRAIITNCSESTNSVLRLYGEDRFTGLASACIRRSLSPAKLEIIIDELEDILKNKYNIKFIDENVFFIDLIDKKGDAFKSLQEIKIESSEASIAHDLLLLHVVSTNRPKSLYKADAANWWVLTDDNKLTNWNAKNSSFKHIPECITEAQLATVMWLCNPKISSLDGLFNTVVAFRSQGLVGNSEYIKISKEIQRQKDRLNGDEPKLKKLSLVLSQRMLSVEELIGENYDEMDDKFDQMLTESQAEIEGKTKKIEEQAQRIAAYETKSVELSLQVKNTTGLLTEKTERLIVTLKARREDKQSQYDLLKKEIVKLENKKEKIINIGACFIKIVFTILLSIGLLKIVPFFNSLEEWYAKHQFLCFVLVSIIPAMASLWGWKKKYIIKFTNFLSKSIILVFVKFKLIQNRDEKINSLNKQMEVIFQEMTELQDEIDAEIAK